MCAQGKKHRINRVMDRDGPAIQQKQPIYRLVRQFQTKCYLKNFAVAAGLIGAQATAQNSLPAHPCWLPQGAELIEQSIAHHRALRIRPCVDGLLRQLF